MISVATCSSALVILASLFLIPSAVCFSTSSSLYQNSKTPSTTSSKTTVYSTTEKKTMESSSQSTSDNYPNYTEEQLKGALDGLLEDSDDPSFDGRHLFGFQDPNHKLSKLQAITATRILDYESYLVSLSRRQTENIKVCLLPWRWVICRNELNIFFLSYTYRVELALS